MVLARARTSSARANGARSPSRGGVPATVIRLVVRSTVGLWHQEPHNRESKEDYRCHTQKCCGPIKVCGHEPKECSAERSTKSCRGTNDPLSQIEPTRAMRKVGCDEYREEPTREAAMAAFAKSWAAVYSFTHRSPTSFWMFKSDSPLSSIRRIIQTGGHSCADSRPSRR
jgi:hypothetical protein